MLHARLLRYIDEVARRGSIRKAASHLNVASTAVNRQILAYEEEIGTQIFERLPRSVRPTAAGEILLRHIRNTLKEHDRVRAEMDALEGLRGGDVTIATFDNLAANLMPQVTHAFRAKHPRIQIRVLSVFGPQLSNVLVDGDADLGLGYNLPELPGIVTLRRYQTRLGAVVAPSHPLAAHPPVRLSECTTYPLIVGDESMSIHGIMRNAFSQAGLAFRPDIESNSVSYMKHLARKQEGVTFMTAVDIVEEQQRGELVHLPIYDQHVRAQPLSLVHRPKGGFRPAAGRFAEEIHIALQAVLPEASQI
jgi:DNA-binding transcriptional LysR family regulator